MPLKTKYMILIISAGCIVWVLWWPQAIDGRILHGETGEPVQDVEVAVRSSILKPWWFLAALAQGDIATSATSTDHTDPDGRFRVWVPAGLRLQHISIDFRKPAFVVRPLINGSRATAGSYFSSDYKTTALGKTRNPSVGRVFEIWPASENVQIGSHDLEIEFGGEQKRIALSDHRYQITVQLERHDDVIELQTRLEDGWILPVDKNWESFVAPLEGYSSEASVQTSCESQTMFFTQASNGSYGWILFDLLPLCSRGDPIRLDYRFGDSAGLRALVCPSEAKLPASGRNCRDR